MRNLIFVVLCWSVVAPSLAVIFVYVCAQSDFDSFAKLSRFFFGEIDENPHDIKSIPKSPAFWIFVYDVLATVIIAVYDIL